MLLTDSDKQASTAAAAAGAEVVSLSLSSYNSDTVTGSQFVQLLDLFLADTTDEQLTQQLMIFVCEGFVQSKHERALHLQQVTAVYSLIRSVCFDTNYLLSTSE